MTAFSDLPWADRLAVMKACTAAGSEFHHRHSNGFRVAIGRDSYGKTVTALEGLGFRCVDLHTFPLGSDKPAERLRHDLMGIPSCAWLFADFQEIKS